MLYRQLRQHVTKSRAYVAKTGAVMAILYVLIYELLCSSAQCQDNVTIPSPVYELLQQSFDKDIE